MAKYRHRIFEMYDNRDEAVVALTPKNGGTATAISPQQTPELSHLTVSCHDAVTHVQFKSESDHADENLSQLRSDFGHLAHVLGIDSKVLLDFTGVDSFSSAHIGALGAFDQKLRNRGSRTVLCCLSPTVRASFFKRR